MNQDSVKWNSVISETQFAVHQTVEGIRTLAHVTAPEQLLFADRGNELRFKLHNGLLGFTTGLERLAKLTVSANHLRLDGEYPSVSKYSHRITQLLDAVQGLDVSSLREKGELGIEDYLVSRPEVPASLVPLLERYAKGKGGRYEYLDSLSGEGVEPGLYGDWMSLANAYEVPDWLYPYLSMASYLPNAIYKIANAAEAQRHWNAEMLLQPYINALSASLHPRSVAIALDCFRLARWISSYLSAISTELFYPDSGLQGRIPAFPYLPEIVNPKFLHSAEEYFGFFILQWDDPTAMREALEAFLEKEDEDDLCM